MDNKGGNSRGPDAGGFLGKRRPHCLGEGLLGSGWESCPNSCLLFPRGFGALVFHFTPAKVEFLFSFSLCTYIPRATKWGSARAGGQGRRHVIEHLLAGVFHKGWEVDYEKLFVAGQASRGPRRQLWAPQSSPKIAGAAPSHLALFSKGSLRTEPRGIAGPGTGALKFPP